MSLDEQIRINLNEQVEDIKSRADFVALTRALLENFKQNPQEWANTSLETYLDAIAAWVEDMDGYYTNQGETIPEVPTWKTLGQILLAAKVYE